MEVINALDAELGRWARPEHFSLFNQILNDFLNMKITQGVHYRLWDELNYYPASQHLYFTGFGALWSKNYEFLGHILQMKITDFARQKQVSLLEKLAPPCLTDRENLYCLFNGQKFYTPQSMWMEQRLRRYFSPDTNDEDISDQFGVHFDEFEIFMAFAHRIQNSNGKEWIIHGRWGWRHDIRDSIITRLKSEIKELGKNSTVMRLEISRNEEECINALDYVSSFASKLNFW